MARVTYFVYSDGFNVADPPVDSPQKKILQIISPQLLLRPLYVPGVLSFSVSFAVQDLDTSVANFVQLIFKGPQNEEVLKTDKIKIESLNEIEAELPIDLRGFQMNMDFRNVEFKIEGEYISEVYFNDELLEKIPINVKSGGRK